MYCFLFQLSSALIPRLHTIETRGAVGHLYPTLWKVGGGGAYFTFHGKHLISNGIISIKEKGLSYQNI